MKQVQIYLMMYVSFKKTSLIAVAGKPVNQKNIKNAYILSLISSNQQFGYPPRLCRHGMAQHVVHT